MSKWLEARRAKSRDAFFFLAGCVIAYHEVFLAKEAQPLLIFTVLFLWGLIPAFWGDRATPKPPGPPEPPQLPPAGGHRAGDGRGGPSERASTYTLAVCT